MYRSGYRTSWSFLFAGLLSLGCQSAEESDPDDGEAPDQETALSPVSDQDETAPAATLAAAPLAREEADNLIDVRGMGDSGWSTTHQETPIAAEFGAALDRFDPTGRAYRGDVSFLNWETVVGSECTQFANAYVRGKSYAFVSRPANLTQAFDRGFNLIGLSNNHTRDCFASPDTALRGEEASADMTARAFEAMGERGLWAGISATRAPADAARARVTTMSIKGRTVRIAFGSLYMGRPSCPRAACAADLDRTLASLRDAQADLRILALHSMGPTDQKELARVGASFVRDYGGDIVFGHGPHVWKPVRIVRKASGGTGVVFESLGNFLHPGLGTQAKNFIGRALFDRETLKLRQVQLLPIANSGRDIRWSNADATALPANLHFTSTSFGRGVYANVKP